ncbi:MAG: hypothetical protein WC661_14630 [Opitutaceae bacterium]
MNPLRPLIILGALLAASTAFAQIVHRADPTKPLDITLGATVQYATHDFYSHTTDHTGPGLQGATRIFPGQSVELVVLAKNYALTSANETAVFYDLTITYPNGRSKTAGRNLRLSVGPVPDAGLLAFASQTASFSTDPGDPLGNYTFTVTARERIGGAPVTKSTSVQVVAYAEPALPADFDPNVWMVTYYLNPSPALALPALLKIADLLPLNNTDAWPPILGFYEEVLKANPWLAPVFLERLKNANEADRTLLLFVLGYAWRKDPTYAGLSKGPWPDADTGELNDPMQLGLLWGRFFATGAFAPLDRIASALHMHRFLGALDKLKAATPTATAPTPEVMKELVLKSAQWSLGRNARVHPLVRRYCEWIIAQKNPDLTFNDLLAATLPAPAAAPASALPPPSEKPLVTFPRPVSP